MDIPTIWNIDTLKTKPQRHINYNDKQRMKHKEEERLRKIEEKKRKEAEKANRPGWFKSTFDKISNEIFSDDDMK